MNERREMLGTPAFIIGGLSYIPLLGIIFGVVAIVWGLTTKKLAGAVLARVGAFGIAFTAILTSVTYYFFYIEEEGFFDKLKADVTSAKLAELVPEIEFFRVQHGKYPETLELLGKSLPETSKGHIYDPVTGLTGDEPKLFYYEIVDDNHYYLLAPGLDGKPFTEDDIVPPLAVAPQGQVGLLVKGPVATFPHRNAADNFHAGRNLAMTALLDSAYNGNARTQAAMGHHYELGGWGLSRNYETAKGWYEKAISLGNSRAKGKLGLMYGEGRGVEKDLEKAFSLIAEAAEDGDSEAQNNLGVLYKRGGGVDKDHQLAVKWYRRSADQGLETAQTNLAYMYANGLGVEKDVQTAYHWYSLAAYGGDLDAHNELAQMLRSGELGEEKIDDAVYLLAGAAALGHSKAQINLGDMYLRGEGKLPIDRDKGIYLIRLAAQQGDDDALKLLNDMVEQEQSI